VVSYCAEYTTWIEVTHECFIAYFVLIAIVIPVDNCARAIVPRIVGLGRDIERAG
jgi:hypothetical protein